MKIAEALLLKKEYQENISSLKERLYANVKIPVDDVIFEDSESLLEKMLKTEDKLKDLTIKLNHRNLNAETSSGKLLADVIAERQTLMSKKKHLDYIMHKVNREGYSSRSEGAMKVTLDLNNIQKEINKVAKEYRELNSELQAANWNIDL